MTRGKKKGTRHGPYKRAPYRPTMVDANAVGFARAVFELLLRKKCECVDLKAVRRYLPAIKPLAARLYDDVYDALDRARRDS